MAHNPRLLFDALEDPVLLSTMNLSRLGLKTEVADVAQGQAFSVAMGTEVVDEFAPALRVNAMPKAAGIARTHERLKPWHHEAPSPLGRSSGRGVDLYDFKPEIDWLGKGRKHFPVLVNA